MNRIFEYLREKMDIDTLCPTTIKDFSRDDFALMLAELGMDVGAEIGVYEASYSRTLIDANKNLKLFCIDPWLELPEYGDKFRMEIAYQTALGRLMNTNSVILRKTSEEALKDFKPDSLDFVYIDGDHSFDGALFDIIHWSDIVKPGGIIAGHDFDDYWSSYAKSYKVKEAVIEYTSKNNIAPWFVFDGRKDYVKSKTKRIPKSWMWVKQ